MKKRIIMGIAILLLVGCTTSNRNELQLVILDGQGNKQEVETISCSNTECEDGYEKYFEVIQIKYDADNPDVEQALASTYYDLNKPETDYIKNSVRNWRYTLVQCFIWDSHGEQAEGTWEFDLCFRRYSEGINGEWISKGDQEWNELKKVTEEMSMDGSLKFTVAIDTYIPEGASEPLSPEINVVDQVTINVMKQFQQSINDYEARIRLGF